MTWLSMLWVLNADEAAQAEAAAETEPEAGVEV